MAKAKRKPCSHSFNLFPDEMDRIERANPDNPFWKCRGSLAKILPGDLAVFFSDDVSGRRTKTFKIKHVVNAMQMGKVVLEFDFENAPF